MTIADLMGLRVLSSSAVPADMVVLVRNAETLQRFVWTANALADQEREIERLRARIAEVERERDNAEAQAADWQRTANEFDQAQTAAERERDEARRNYQFMVDRAADQKLDGYRELGARAAAAEERACSADRRLGEVEGALAEARTALVSYGCRHRTVCADEACRAAGHEHESYGEDGWSCGEECPCVPACEGHEPNVCQDAEKRLDLVVRVDEMLAARPPSERRDRPPCDAPPLIHPSKTAPPLPWGTDPWPIAGVLEILADAADHLRGEHNCDAEGHERVLYAAQAARLHAEALRASPPRLSAPLSDDRLTALESLHAPISHEEVLSLIAEVRRLRSPAQPSESIGTRIAWWVTTCFGSAAMKREERATRLLEEAVELAQAEGVPQELVDRLTRHVYSKPVGDPPQEGAGVALCLEAWAVSAGQDVRDLALRELERVEGFTPEHFRKRHAAKVAAGSAVAHAPADPTKSPRCGGSGFLPALDSIEPGIYAPSADPCPGCPDCADAQNGDEPDDGGEGPT